MSQFTRGQLKSLVKECLVEILSEGLAAEHSVNTAAIQEKRMPTSRTSPTSIPLRSGSPALNSVVFGASQSSSTKKTSSESRKTRASNESKFESAMRERIGTLTTDPIMSQIFADTASSTLQEHIQADSGQGRPDLSSESAPDPISDDFLAESAKHWSMLAFSDAAKSR